MGLDQSLADGEAEAGADAGRAVSGVFAEQLREALRRHAAALVAHRDRHMHPVAGPFDADRRGLRRMPDGVGEQVVQHLHDAVAVGHRPGQVRRQVDDEPVPGAAGQERGARPVHQRRDLRGLRRDRQRARVDAPGVQQVGDEAAHAVGLLVDDPEELPNLGRTVEPRGAEHRGGRALDGGERGAQLVAHHAQELRPHALQLLERRQVLHGDHHRGDRAVLGVDRRRVDQRGDAPAVGDREHHLLGPHRLGVAQLVREREPVERDLAPVGAPAGDDLEQVLGGAAGHAQALHDPRRLAVERHRLAGPGIEHQHADRRGLDQGLQVGARLPLGPVGVRVGDRRRGLRGEQQKDLLVLARERRRAFLSEEVEVADMHAAMAHRRALEGPLPRYEVRGEAERAHIGGHVRQPERAREVAEELEQPRPVGPLLHPPVLLVGEPGGDEVPGQPRLVDGGDGAVARVGERAGALDDLLEHRVEVEAGADAQAGRAQGGDALAQRFDLAVEVVVSVQASLLLVPIAGRKPVRG